MSPGQGPNSSGVRGARPETASPPATGAAFVAHPSTGNPSRPPGGAAGYRATQILATSERPFPLSRTV